MGTGQGISTPTKTSHSKITGKIQLILPETSDIYVQLFQDARWDVYQDAEAMPTAYSYIHGVNSDVVQDLC